MMAKNKITKSLVALMVAFCLLFSMTAIAFADYTPANGDVISTGTVKNVYQLTSQDTATKQAAMAALTNDLKNQSYAPFLKYVGGKFVNPVTQNNAKKQAITTYLTGLPGFSEAVQAGTVGQFIQTELIAKPANLAALSQAVVAAKKTADDAVVQPTQQELNSYNVISAGPTVSNVYIEGANNSGRADATIANGKISFVVDPDFYYTTGGLTLSSDLVTVTGTINGIAFNKTVNINSDFVDLLKTALNIQVNQIKGSTLINHSGAQFTLTKDGKSTTYTVEVTAPTVGQDFEVIDIY